MADTKLADLTSGAPAAASDILYVVRDPSGTPLDRKLTIANVKDYILGLANTWTGKQTISGASFTLSGNISAPAWTTSGIRYANVAATLTDTSSSGTVAAAYTDLFGGNTIAASNATTFTDYFTMYVSAATAGTNVTMTNKWALGLAGNLKLGPDASGTNQAGTNVTIGGSRGTGTGAGGSFIFQVAPAGTTGTAQNALATALTISPGTTSGGPTATISRALITSYGQSTATGRQAMCSLGFDDVSGLLTIGSPGGVLTVSVASTGRLGFSSGSNNNWNDIDVSLFRDAANTLALRNGANAQRFNSYRSYTDGSNYSRVSLAWNTSTALVMAEGAGTGSDGSVAFNDAALATNATVGFVMIPSCAGAPSGTPADIPTGQIPMVWDSTNLKLYVYTGGAWKASAAFT